MARFPNPVNDPKKTSLFMILPCQLHGLGRWRSVRAWSRFNVMRRLERMSCSSPSTT